MFEQPVGWLSFKTCFIGSGKENGTVQNALHDSPKKYRDSAAMYITLSSWLSLTTAGIA
jgi:hypothetical protein